MVINHVAVVVVVVVLKNFGQPANWFRNNRAPLSLSLSLSLFFDQRVREIRVASAWPRSKSGRSFVEAFAGLFASRGLLIKARYRTFCFSYRGR